MALLRLLSAVLLLRCAVAQSPGFMLVSAPRDGKISWVRLPDGEDYAGTVPKTLIDTGLQHPQGIAVDQKRKRLYVADPDVQKIYSYQLFFSGKSVMTDQKQTVISTGAESRWVAIDGAGNVFFSDEPRNLILRVPADKVLRGVSEPEVVYNGSNVEQVNQPGGVAADNFHVYWTNKHFGTQVGTVMRASEFPERSETKGVTVLASNLVKSYGVCMSLGNIYYTDAQTHLYGVKKSGGPIAEVTASLKSPRGCAWDGDGTVYVADRGANAVYAFAGNMPTITQAKMTKAFDAEDAFGLAVAVDSGAFARRLSLVGGALAVLAAMRGTHM